MTSSKYPIGPVERSPRHNEALSHGALEPRWHRPVLPELLRELQGLAEDAAIVEEPGAKLAQLIRGVIGVLVTSKPGTFLGTSGMGFKVSFGWEVSGKNI